MLLNLNKLYKKLFICLFLSLLCIMPVSAGHGGDSSEAGNTSLMSAAVLSGAGVYLASIGIISLSAGSLGVLGDLTFDALDSTVGVIECSSCNYNNAPSRTVKYQGQRKQIDLVIREDDYIELEESH